MREQSSLNVRLKTRYFEIDKLAPVDHVLDIQVPHLVVGIFTPETSTVVENALNRLNLKPYEQACKQFANADYTFDAGAINNPGQRLIKGMDTLAANTSNTNGKCPVIVAYIEFPLNT